MKQCYAVLGCLPALFGVEASAADDGPDAHGGVGAPAAADKTGAVERGEATTKPAIVLAVTPDHLLLGDDETATVTVEVRDSATSPQITTNIGRLDTPRALEPGVWEAIYHAPEVAIPQVAIISAFVAGKEGAQAFLALPLFGRGTALARTVPGGRIQVRIREQRFGPATADRHGLARIPVVVPPGIDNAFDGERPIPLGVPPTNHLHAAIAPRQVSAGRRLELMARIWVVRADGTPNESAVLALKTTRGVAADPVAKSPGYFEAIWTLPPRPAGDDTLEIKLVGEPESRASVVVRSLRGLPAHIELDLEPASAVAEEGLLIAATVRVSDGGKNPVAAAVGVEASLGEVSVVSQKAPGVYQAQLALPVHFDLHDSVEVRAYLEGGLEAQKRLALRAAAPAAVAIFRPQAAVVADGERSMRLRLVVTDRFGNPVPDAKIDASSELGDIRLAPHPVAQGYDCDFLPPRTLLPGEAELRVSVGSTVTSALTVDLLPAPAFLVLAPRLGLLTNFGRVISPALGAELSVWHHLGGLQFGAGLELSYAINTREAEVRAGERMLPVAAVEHFVFFIGQLAWRYAFSPHWLLWVHTGGGASLVSSGIVVEGQPASTVVVGIPVFAGSVALGWRWWRGFFFGELGFRYLGNANLTNLRGDVPSLLTTVGYRLALF